ncbi:uncharacterized protein BJ171DRAFT_597882 [Polychytrium aggregatum]|uniref:uncharacterized protein n=1 Tax=Polychytrium aggregatum TaxID=110093 RepID=UPI0022FDE0FD|nr:uncharacterized protein BJ171DRAFT_597882 [Polychytrium aggregatum]KAI9206216.1 hypothetical protein BJ171DRAFT_597882 [Polychytrium aggregatum]
MAAATTTAVAEARMRPPEGSIARASHSSRRTSVVREDSAAGMQARNPQQPAPAPVQRSPSLLSPGIQREGSVYSQRSSRGGRADSLSSVERSDIKSTPASRAEAGRLAPQAEAQKKPVKRSVSISSKVSTRRSEKFVVALYDYTGDTDEELNFYTNDVFRVINDDNPDWWFVQFIGEPPREGYIPSNYVEIKEYYGSQTDENERRPTLSHRKGRPRADSDESRSCTDDDGGGGEGDGSDNNYGTDGGGDDDDDGGDVSDSDSRGDGRDNRRHRARLSRDAPIKLKAKGRMPRSSGRSNQPTSTNDRAEPQRPKVRKRPNRPTATKQHDDLRMYGPLPQGFRHSTLFRLYGEGIGHSSDYLYPDYEESGLGFCDIFYDFKKSRIRRRLVKCTIAFSLMEARNVPLPGPGVTILGRHVRLSLFDKTDVLSNIHCVPASFNPEFGDAWKFTTKPSLLFPKDDENTCFLRVNDVDIRLCILFELCLVVVKPGATKNPYAPRDDIHEISCGWGLLPLYTSDGGPIDNRTYDIKLYGGTPFDEDVNSLDSAEPKGFFSRLLSPNRMPRLVIRVWKLGKSVMTKLNELPDVMIGSLAAVPVLAAYRELLANHIYVQKETAQRASVLGPSAEAALALLPKLVEQHDVLLMLVHLWEKKLQSLTRDEKKSFRILKAKFTECVLALWPLSCIHEVPEYVSGDDDRTHLRQVFLAKWREVGPMESLTRNPERFTYEPFHTDESELDLLNPDLRFVY